MRVIEYNGKTEISEFGTSAMALGFFDGVHFGHRDIIAGAVKSAKEQGLIPAVFSFPAESRGIKTDTPRIYSTKDKLRIFEMLGVELVILADFSAVRDLPAEVFVRQVLYEQLKCREAHCGYNFHFGKGALGDADMLQCLMNRLGAKAVIYSQRKYMGQDLSATAVKKAMQEGDIKRVNAMLGAPYFVRGTVRRGLGIGHTWGIPTVNLALEDTCPLMRGVYFTRVTVGTAEYTGITNVGICPTVSERELHAETFILDYNGELYGSEIVIHFLELLRPELTFASTEELRQQIRQDEKKARLLAKGSEAPSACMKIKSTERGL